MLPDTQRDRAGGDKKVTSILLSQAKHPTLSVYFPAFSLPRSFLPLVPRSLFLYH
jgi:hypothetical protein